MSTKQPKRSHHAAKTAKAATSSEPKSKSILHERDGIGRHRIVVVENGMPDESQWFECYEVAHHKGLHAVTEFFEGSQLKPGIFRAAPVAHQRMGKAFIFKTADA